MSVRYSDRVVRQFVVAALLWGGLTMLVGLGVAAQLLFPHANVGPELSFGRLRPLHVYATSYAFVGNIVFAGIYFSSQRMLRVRVPSERGAATHFWGWQLMVAAAALSLVFGHSQGREGAAVAWPIDAAAAALWLVFGMVFVSMVRRRNEERLYVALWFYMAAIVGVGAVLVAKLVVVPVGALASYPIWGGAVDALSQAWIRHGLQSFLFSAPVFGFMYYVVPLAAGGRLYSYRIAVAHFWGFLFVASWIAPAALVHTALPEWLQAIGIAMAFLLWVPVWAGVLNGLCSMRGAGSRLLGDPVLQLAAAALVCLGLAALETPLLTAGAVSRVTGYTDWTQGTSHLGSMGGVGLMGAALLYWVVPRAFGSSLHSQSAARAHVYLALVGLVVYMGATWLAGATQGVMLQAQDAAGGMTYEFVETLAALDLAYGTRIAGGGLYLVGFLVMGWNLVQTMAAGRAPPEEAAAGAARAGRGRPGLSELVFAPPVIVAAGAVALLIAAGLSGVLGALASVFLSLCIATGGWLAMELHSYRQERFHPRLECHALALSLLIAAALLHGGVVQGIALQRSQAEVGSGEARYTPLELEGRDVYRHEGCASCHTQMIRPLLSEVARYGEVSSRTHPQDRPALWGGRRVGPDLARIGERAGLSELYEQLVDPRAEAAAPRMPSYGHLSRRRIDRDRTGRKLRAQAMLGVPYGGEETKSAPERLLAQGEEIAGELAREAGVELEPDSELIALLAYLQRLGSGDEDASSRQEESE